MYSIFIAFKVMADEVMSTTLRHEKTCMKPFAFNTLRKCLGNWRPLKLKEDKWIHQIDGQTDGRMAQRMDDQHDRPMDERLDDWLEGLMEERRRLDGWTDDRLDRLWTMGWTDQLDGGE